MNPDASLFVAEPDSGGHARHDCADREGSLGSVARMRAVCCTGSPWRSLAHSRCCRDRSTSRSAPGRGSAHRDTGARLHLPVCLRHTDVDESPHRWDTAPAYVPRHVVGRGVDTNLQVGIGAVPVFNEDRHLTHFRIFASSSAASRHAHPSSGAKRNTIPRHSAPLPCSRQSRWLLVTTAEARHNSRSRLLKERLIALLPPRSKAARGARRRSPRSIKKKHQAGVPAERPPCSEASVRAGCREGRGSLRHD